MSEPQATSACLHAEAVGTRWGDPISAERQAELQRTLDQWEAEYDEDERHGPFAAGADTMKVRLTELDVFWLAAQGESTLDDPAPSLHLEGADLTGAHLEGADLGGAHLLDAVLIGAHLADATLREAHLEGSALLDADLQDADLRGAHLEGADLGGARLEGANLRGARREGVIALRDATLDSTTSLDDDE